MYKKGKGEKVDGDVFYKVDRGRRAGAGEI